MIHKNIQMSVRLTMVYGNNKHCDVGATTVANNLQKLVLINMNNINIIFLIIL